MILTNRLTFNFTMAIKKKKDDPDMSRRFIKSFTLENVRTFNSPATIDFCLPTGKIAQWTVILGENGTGKTSLLQYLAGMVPVQEVVAPTKQKNAPPPFRPMLGGGEWIEWNAENLPRPWKRPSTLKVEAELSGPSESLAKVNIKTAQKFSLTVNFDKDPDGRPKVKSSYTLPADLDFFRQFQIFAYGASRHVAGPASPYLTSESFFRNDSPNNTLFQDDVPLISPEQWILGLDHTARSGGEIGDRAAKISMNARRCLSKALPDVTSIDVRPHGILRSSVAMTLMCSTPYGEVPFSALSLGYRTMAAWLTDFLRRMHESYPLLENPDNGPAVVIIDEFDLHMHPAWQRTAMRALSEEFPNTQFIVTVHSPLVVQAAEKNAKIIVLRKKATTEEREEIIIDSDPRLAAGWRIDQILESDLYDMSSRSEEYTRLLNERIRLRQKNNPTSKDKSRLKILEKNLDEQAPPGIRGSTADLLREVREALKDD